jgi:hypothetical protein
MADKRIVHCGELSTISDFLQDICGSYSVRRWSLADPSDSEVGGTLSVMAGLDPAIYAPSAQSANRFKFM